MAGKRTRRRCTAEFRAQAVKRVRDGGGRPLADVATEMGVSTGQPSTWRMEHLATGSAEASAARTTKVAGSQRLEREVKWLEEENLILRKAAVVFAPRIA